MDVHVEAILRKDKFCENMDHNKAVDKYCANRIDMCINAGKESFHKVKRKQKHGHIVSSTKEGKGITVGPDME